MHSNPLISIIIPYYNCEQYIEETLASIEGQTYKNFEVILVNDGSKEDSTLFLKNLLKHKNIHYLYQDNKGVSAARNLGATIAKGEFLLFVDADNKLHSHYLEKTHKTLLSNPKCKLVYTKAEFFEAKTGVWDIPTYTQFQDLLFSNKIDSLALIKKSDFELLNGFDETFNTHEDWDYWIRLLKDGGEVIFLDEVLYYYRKRLDKTSLTDMLIENPTINKKDWQKIYIKHSDIYIEHNLSFLELIQAYQKHRKNHHWLKKFFYKITLKNW